MKRENNKVREKGIRKEKKIEIWKEVVAERMKKEKMEQNKNKERDR